MSGNPGGKLLYIGDAEDKDLYVDTAGLEALKLPSPNIQSSLISLSVTRNVAGYSSLRW